MRPIPKQCSMLVRVSAVGLIRCQEMPLKANNIFAAFDERFLRCV